MPSVDPVTSCAAPEHDVEPACLPVSYRIGRRSSDRTANDSSDGRIRQAECRNGVESGPERKPMAHPRKTEQSVQCSSHALLTRTPLKFDQLKPQRRRPHIAGLNGRMTIWAKPCSMSMPWNVAPARVGWEQPGRPQVHQSSSLRLGSTSGTDIAPTFLVAQHPANAHSENSPTITECRDRMPPQRENTGIPPKIPRRAMAR
jgi:hypothetical protein